MRVGLVARGEDRGLGIQTWEFYRHVQPNATLLVDMGELARGFPSHAGRYPDAEVAAFRGGQLPEQQVRAWLRRVDVVFTAETLYDWHLADWARAVGVATVVQVNPEFYRHACDALPHPSCWWAPTVWRREHLHPHTRLVPVPVAADRFRMRPPERAGPLRVLHVAGHRAAADRNGTLQLLQALRLVRQPMRVRIVTQDARLPRVRPHMRGVDLELVTGGVPDYWRLYDDADVLVMPRRYGGLCLPVQEAMAAGLAVVMTDVPPNTEWPVVPVRTAARGTLRTGTGDVPLHAAHPPSLANALDQLAADPDHLLARQKASVAWAELHSWQRMLPLYRVELLRAAEHP